MSSTAGRRDTPAARAALARRRQRAAQTLRATGNDLPSANVPTSGPTVSRPPSTPTKTQNLKPLQLTVDTTTRVTQLTKRAHEKRKSPSDRSWMDASHTTAALTASTTASTSLTVNTTATPQQALSRSAEVAEQATSILNAVAARSRYRSTSPKPRAQLPSPTQVARPSPRQLSPSPRAAPLPPPSPRAQTPLRLQMRPRSPSPIHHKTSSPWIEQKISPETTERPRPAPIQTKEASPSPTSLQVRAMKRKQSPSPKSIRGKKLDKFADCTVRSYKKFTQLPWKKLANCRTTLRDAPRHVIGRFKFPC